MVGHVQRGRAGITLAEALIGVLVLQAGVLVILFSIFNVSKADLRRDQSVEANYLANYLLAEIIAKDYQDPYDPNSHLRGVDPYGDDRGYDRTADDPFDTDYMNLSNIAPDSFSNNDGVRNHASLGESDAIRTRREWNDVDDYHGFVWAPPFADEWNVPLLGDYRDLKATVVVESVRLTALDVPVAWDNTTGAKRVTVAVLLRGDTVLVEKAVKLEKYAKK